VLVACRAGHPSSTLAADFAARLNDLGYRRDVFAGTGEVSMLDGGANGWGLGVAANSHDGLGVPGTFVRFPRAGRPTPGDGAGPVGPG
jgi:hypothetical protein